LTIPPYGFYETEVISELSRSNAGKRSCKDKGSATTGSFRLVSGLKLLEGGLELSSVGVLTVFTPNNAAIPAKQLGDRIRKIRTLPGLGLPFANVAALEAPWFLDRDYTRAYEQAIFGQ
jgi:hypothetical protein